MSKLHMNTGFDDLRVTLTLNSHTNRELSQALREEKAGLNRVTVIELLVRKMKQNNLGKRNVKAR